MSGFVLSTCSWRYEYVLSGPLSAAVSETTRNCQQGGKLLAIRVLTFDNHWKPILPFPVNAIYSGEIR